MFYYYEIRLNERAHTNNVQDVDIDECIVFIVFS